MPDISKVTLLDNQTYDLKDSTAREHIQDHNNPHQVTAEQAGAISKIWDYSFKNVSGWYKFLTINITANNSKNILLLVQDTYSYNGGPLSYKAIISLYITRTSAGAFSSSANLLAGYGFTKDSFYYTYDSSSGDVSIYVSKRTNNNGSIGVTVMSSLGRAGRYLDLSDNFESTATATLPEGGWYFQAMQDGAGNVIPDTYATKDELLSTVISKGAIGASADIDTLTTPGMWYSSTGLQTNWPSQGKPGRLLVFGSYNTTKARKVQLVVCNTDGVDDAKFYYRIGILSGSSSPWGSWTRVATEADFEYSTDEVTGDIVTFETASAQVLPSVVVDIDPVQDLHGYDHPWPAGGWKNLFRNPPEATTSAGVTITPNSDGSITLSGTANSSALLYCAPVDIPANTTVTFSFNNTATNSEIGVRLINTESIELGTVYGTAVYLNANNKTGTVTQTFNAKAINLFVKSNHGDVPEITLKIQCEIGSSATAWTPYENICPISGLDGCIVERAGKNLFDKTQTMLTGHFINANGEIQAHNYYQVSDYIKVSPSTVYSFSGTITNDVTNAVAFFDSNKNFISRYLPGATNTPSRFTTPSNCAFIRFNWSNISSQLDTIQLEKGSTATQYEPYQNSTYSISFPSSAGTVYGGTLDVTNGVLTVDRAMVDMGTLNWQAGTSAGIFWIYSTRAPATYWVPPASDDDAVDFICSKYQAIPFSGYNTKASGIWWHIGSGEYIGFRDPNYVNWTTANVKSDLSGETLIVRLKSPVTYQLTPTQITALLGQNNLWADTGDVSVVYREGKNALLKDVADAVHTLQPKLLFDTTPTEGSTNPVTSGGVKTALDAKVNDSVIATVEPTSTASEYHGSGDPFMLNGNLYQAAGNIAEGETIVPGTNAYLTNAVQYTNYIGEMLSEDIGSRFDELSASDVGAINKSADFVCSAGSSWFNFLNVSFSSYPAIGKSVLRITNYKNIANILICVNRSGASSITVNASILASSLYAATDFCYKVDSSTHTASFYVKALDTASTIEIQTLYNNGSGTFSFQNTGMSQPPSGVSYFKPMQDGNGNYIPDIYYRRIPDHIITTDGSSGGWYKFLTVSPATTSYTNMALLVQSSAFSPFCIISFSISGRHGLGTYNIMGGGFGDNFIYAPVGGQDYIYSAFYMYIPNNTKVQFWSLYDYEEAYFPQYSKPRNWEAELQSTQPSGYELTPITSFTKNGTITLSLSWNGSGPYTQTVTASRATITEKSSVSLQPTAAQLSQLIADGVTAITIENNAGTLTAYAFGGTNSTSMTIQCIVQELS